MSALDSKASRSHWVLFPPPPLFVLAFVAGVLLGRVAPLALVPHALHLVARGVGLVLMAVAISCIGSAVALFIRRRTTIIPHASAHSLVVAGPFRITRNPMYLGLSVGYLGLALVMNLLWPLVFLIVPLWVLQAKVIPFEEQTMLRIFGDEYTTYARRVGRWLTLSLRPETSLRLRAGFPGVEGERRGQREKDRAPRVEPGG